MVKIGILASHNGTGFDALNEACKNGILDASISVVISNNSDALVLQKAKANNIPNFIINSKLYDPSHVDQKILETLLEYDTQIVFLSGYMKKIDPLIIKKFENKMFNAHPSLLPKFGGAGMYGRFVHEAVIEAKEPYSGVSVHKVTQNYDEGAIVLQKQIEVLGEETPQSLESKIKSLEKIVIVEAFEKILEQK